MVWANMRSARILTLVWMVSFVYIPVGGKAGQGSLNAVLIQAVKQGDFETAKRLIERGADPNARETITNRPTADGVQKGGKAVPGDTAMILAVKQGRMDLTKLLLRSGVNVNGRGAAGFTPLIAAVRYRAGEIFLRLLEGGAQPDLRNANGDTALVFAANEGLSDIATVLLAKGANVNGGGGSVPLTEAAYNGHADIVALLIRKGADIRRRNRAGLNALECARLQGHADIVQILVAAGAHGRSEAALRREAEREAQKLRAQWHANALRYRTERIVTDRDRAVIATALRDLLVYPGQDLPLDSKGKTQIVLCASTAAGPGLISDAQLNSDLEESKANAVSSEMRAHLQRRNWEPVTLTALKTISRTVVLAGPEIIRGSDAEFGKRFPGARAWVQTYLPGYTQKGDHAVLRFWIGPSLHGAAGTYFLDRQRADWKVRWRGFAFYD